MTRFAVAAYREGGDRDGEHDIYFIEADDAEAARAFVEGLSANRVKLHANVAAEVPDEWQPAS